MTLPRNHRNALTLEGRTPRRQCARVNLFWQPSSCHVFILLILFGNDAWRVVLGWETNLVEAGDNAMRAAGAIQRPFRNLGRERHEELGLGMTS